VLKRVLATSTVIAGLSTGALAADLPVYEPTPAPVAEPAPSFDWTGPYIGLQAGYLWGKNKFKEHDAITGSFIGEDKYDIDGFTGGAHAGYNWQHGKFVYGVEGDIEYTNLEGDMRVGDSLLGVEANWQASIRARLGMTVAERSLIYATGGAAFADIEHVYAEPGMEMTVSETKTGWTVGAGAEHAFTDHITARLEYRYTDFGDISHDLRPLWESKGENKLHAHAVRVGFSYKF